MNSLKFNTVIENSFNEYENKQHSFIENCEGQQKRIGFITDLLFNDKNDEDSAQYLSNCDIENFISNKEDFYNSVWTNSRNNPKPNISFLKIFSLEMIYIDDDMDKIKEYLQSFMEVSLNHENNQSTSTYEKLDMIKDNIQIEEGKKIIFNYFIYINNLENKKEQKEVSDNINKIWDKLVSDQNASKTFPKKHNVLRVVFNKDIEKIIEENKNVTLLVENGEIEIDFPNNMLQYKFDGSQEITKSLIVNASAKSINQLWNKHKNNLLGLNLRLHIKKKSIDDKMKESMLQDNKYFWFKNNGLVIICSDLETSGNKLILKNFSIVNGGQTTHNIGTITNEKSDLFENDHNFYVATKIIVMSDPSQTNTLASEIANSTNQQKPIQNVDLISNLPSIKNVVQKFNEIGNKPGNIPLFIISRRGEKIEPSKLIKGEKKLQEIKIEQILQIYSAFTNLEPGTSRSGKAKLYSKKDKVDESFINVAKSPLLFLELWTIFSTHEAFKVEKIRKIAFENSQQEEMRTKATIPLIKFGSYFVISLVKVILVLLNSKEETISLIGEQLKEEYEGKSFDKTINLINSKFEELNIDKCFSSNISVNKEGLANLKQRYMEFLINNISKIYEKSVGSWKKAGDARTGSNFTKTNYLFFSYFLDEFLYDFEQNKEKREAEYSNLFLMKKEINE